MANIALRLATLSVNDVITLAMRVHDKMSALAAVFVTPPVLLVDFADQISDLQAAQQENTVDPSKSKTVIRDLKLKDVNFSLTILGKYVQVTSKGDPTVIQSAGFDLRRTGPRKYPTIDPPILGKLSYTSNLGEIKLQWKRIFNARAYEIQYCLDPMTFDGWQHAGFTIGGLSKVGDLPSGQVVWFRVRSIGAPGGSEWSPAASIRVS
jgi:hypothetical protein